MSGFSDTWLALREPVDARSRDRDAVERLVAWLDDTSSLAVTDLGCGSGAGFRWLAPRLPMPQRWRCVDADRSLLEALTVRVCAWAGGLGWRCEGRDASLALVDTARRKHRLDTVARDLAVDDLGPVLAGCRLLVASALIDLVSEAWLRRLVDACRRSGCAVMLPLCYDGRLSLAPQRAEDDLLREHFNRHQQRDKGFGPALGPAAAGTAATLFAHAGYQVFETNSDWRLGAGDGALMAPLLAGWLDAVGEQDASASLALADWRRIRRAELERGELAVTVGHRDLLALPP